MTSARPITCCKAIPGVAAHEVAGSLVGDMCVTGYYDGPTEGILQCPACGSVYHFKTLAWSRNHFIRVISLSPLPPDSMTKIVSFFAERPTGSPWIPRALAHATDQDLDRIEPFLVGILAEAGPPSIVLAWDIVTNEVLAARQVGVLPPEHWFGPLDLDVGSAGKEFDWFADLGVPQDG
jgi:hypothetical protein